LHHLLENAHSPLQRGRGGSRQQHCPALIEATHFLKRSFYPLVEKARLPRIHFHDLRHTVAHLMKKEGVRTSGISETFGHENRDITDRFYGHGAPGLQRQVVEAMERALHKKSDVEHLSSSNEG
jgi:integrase